LLEPLTRPSGLEEVVGQDHLLGPDGPIGRMAASRQLASMIPWGPPRLRQDDDRAATSPTVNALVDSDQCRRQMPN
jgi:hypothetical protein